MRAFPKAGWLNERAYATKSIGAMNQMRVSVARPSPASSEGVLLVSHQRTRSAAAAHKPNPALIQASRRKVDESGTSSISRSLGGVTNRADRLADVRFWLIADTAGSGRRRRLG